MAQQNADHLAHEAASRLTGELSKMVAGTILFDAKEIDADAPTLRGNSAAWRRCSWILEGIGITPDVPCRAADLQTWFAAPMQCWSATRVSAIAP
jgi:hypothetical protein